MADIIIIINDDCNEKSMIVNGVEMFNKNQFETTQCQSQIEDKWQFIPPPHPTLFHPQFFYQEKSKI